MMNEKQEEIISRAISNSMPNGTPTCFDCMDEEYFRYARAIVEPDVNYGNSQQMEALDAYYSFQESKPEAWRTWILENFGEHYAKLADVVNENGW